MLGAVVGGIFTLLGTTLAFTLTERSQRAKATAEKTEGALLAFLGWWQAIGQQPRDPYDFCSEQSEQELRMYLFVRHSRINHALDRALETRGLANLAAAQNWEDVQYPARRLWRTWMDIAAKYSELALRQVDEGDEVNALRTSENRAEADLAHLQEGVEGRKVYR